MERKTFAEMSALTEDEARSYIEAIRWPNGPICPRCGSTSATKLQGKSTRAGVYKCKAKECRKPFTVTVGTIFEDTRIPLRKWVLAFWLICGSKKGMSTHQIHRHLGITYKSAWHMTHRIREAMREGPLAELLKGTVEADETYIGGRRNLRNQWTNKIPVMALVERGGSVRAFPIERLNSKNLQLGLVRNVHRSSRIMTDEHMGYGGAARSFEGGHHTVNHGRSEYARGEVSTNTVEGFFSILKRGVNGTFHHVSKQHLARYVDEFSFRYNTRKVTDQERTQKAIEWSAGKRLTYRLVKSAKHAKKESS